MELLKHIKGLAGRGSIVYCATCHRGEVKPATNLPRPQAATDGKKLATGSAVNQNWMPKAEIDDILDEITQKFQNDFDK